MVGLEVVDNKVTYNETLYMSLTIFRPLSFLVHVYEFFKTFCCRNFNISPIRENQICILDFLEENSVDGSPHHHHVIDLLLY